MPEPSKSEQIELAQPDFWLENPDFDSKITDLNELIDESFEYQVLDSSPTVDLSSGQLNQSDQTSK